MADAAIPMYVRWTILAIAASTWQNRYIVDSVASALRAVTAAVDLPTFSTGITPAKYLFYCVPFF
jgi:hypothetical protein